MQIRILLIITLLLGSVLGQPPSGDMARNRQNMDAIRIWKLTEVLELTEDQVASFLPLVQIHERELREVQREVMTLTKEGRELLEGEGISQKEVDKFTKQYLERQEKMFTIKNDFIKALPKHLTPEQQLLYLSFETRFRNELREYMKNERRGMRQPRSQDTKNR